MHVGLRIAKMMQVKGISTKRMAEHCGVTPGAVSNWFSSGRISKGNLVKAAELLDAELAGLIQGAQSVASTKSLISKHSSQAQELATLFDLLPADPIVRASAWNRASDAIMQSLRETQLSDTPSMSRARKKRI